ncbi:MAG: Fic family protein [Armatimonadia bacterium]
MRIEGARQLVDVLPLPPDAAFMLKHEALRRSTRFSTAIEGNTVQLGQIPEGIALADRTGLQQQQEVRNYWIALEWLERQLPENILAKVLPAGWKPTRHGLGVTGQQLFTEQFVRTLHSIIITRHRGRRPTMSEYRVEECPVVDQATRTIEYGPPVPADVPMLMAALVRWRNSDEAAGLPAPLRAAVLAYQFVTIHPFPDGNGRTARALATAELWFSGYRMRGFLSVEEEYFKDLQRYYSNLQMDLPVDYYHGRNDPDLTPWLAYFVETMATAAESVKQRALQLHDNQAQGPVPWEQLNRRQQQLLSRLLIKTPGEAEVPTFSPLEIADWFMISDRTARAWLEEWHAEGVIEPASGQTRIRTWRLNNQLAQLVENLRSGGPAQQ